MLIEKCNNHYCELNSACKCYNQKTSTISEYFKPKIYYDGVNKPKLVCKHLIPHNIDYIIRRSKMNFEKLDSDKSIRKKIKLKIFNIVQEFGDKKKLH